MTTEAGPATEVALGWVDGMRFVGIQPPLTDEEIAGLIAEGLLQQRQIENITLEPACTLIRSGVSGSPAVATQLAAEKAQQVAEHLRSTRSTVEVRAGIVSLCGYQSSPFNSYTDSH